MLSQNCKRVCNLLKNRALLFPVLRSVLKNMACLELILKAFLLDANKANGLVKSESRSTTNIQSVES